MVSKLRIRHKYLRVINIFLVLKAESHQLFDLYVDMMITMMSMQKMGFGVVLEDEVVFFHRLVVCTKSFLLRCPQRIKYSGLQVRYLNTHICKQK